MGPLAFSCATTPSRLVIRALLGATLLVASLSCIGAPNPLGPSAPAHQQEQAKKVDEHVSINDKSISTFPTSLTMPTKPQSAPQPQTSDGYASAEWWAVRVAVIVAVIAFVAACIAFSQMLMFRKQLALIGASNRTAAVAANAAEASANGSWLQAKSAMVAERAYVKLSHKEPGIERVDEQSYVVRLEVKNWGRTPAHVTDVMIGFKKLKYGTSLPIPYPYPDAKRESFPNGFLVPNESLYVHRHTSPHNVLDTSEQLWVFGHVDYVDIFDRRWRGGYARKYVGRSDNNLMYDTEGRHNYDRERTPDEGIDWDEKSIAAYNARKEIAVNK